MGLFDPSRSSVRRPKTICVTGEKGRDLAWLFVRVQVRLFGWCRRGWDMM